jgi:hypothetical protein
MRVSDEAKAWDAAIADLHGEALAYEAKRVHGEALTDNGERNFNDLSGECAVSGKSAAAAGLPGADGGRLGAPKEESIRKNTDFRDLENEFTAVTRAQHKIDGANIRSYAGCALGTLGFLFGAGALVASFFYGANGAKIADEVTQLRKSNVELEQRVIGEKKKRDEERKQCDTKIEGLVKKGDIAVYEDRINELAVAVRDIEEKAGATHKHEGCASSQQLLREIGQRVETLEKMAKEMKVKPATQPPVTSAAVREKSVEELIDELGRRVENYTRNGGAGALEAQNLYDSLIQRIEITKEGATQRELIEEYRHLIDKAYKPAGRK